MRALKLLAVPVLTLMLAGCQTAKEIKAWWLPTPTIAPADRPATGKTAINSQLDRICAVWLPVTYDSTKDTPATIKDARANNAARKGFGCR